jgi:hypothetical protein
VLTSDLRPLPAQTVQHLQVQGTGEISPATSWVLRLQMELIHLLEDTHEGSMCTKECRLLLA